MDVFEYTDARHVSESKLLLFGGTGAIGTAVRDYFRQHRWEVVVVTRDTTVSDEQVSWNPVSSNKEHLNGALAKLKLAGPFDAVCWAQGVNCSDSLYEFNSDQHFALYQANVLYILNSLHILLNHEFLKKPARLCVVSSIWQNIARQNKLSYCITKSALEGLVLSAAVDLAKDGHVINAVLPGVIDTPMTHANLSQDQLSKVQNSTLFGRLPKLDEVAACVHSLCKSNNTAVTGQFIAVDLGYSHVRII